MNYNTDHIWFDGINGLPEAVVTLGDPTASSMASVREIDVNGLMVQPTLKGVFLVHAVYPLHGH